MEHVQAKINLSYHRRGDVVLYLTSPMGTRSKILPRRPNDMNAGAFKDWHLLSVHFWGERPQGTWILEVEDGNHYMGSSAGMAPWGYVNPSTGGPFFFPSVSSSVFGTSFGFSQHLGFSLWILCFLF